MPCPSTRVWLAAKPRWGIGTVFHGSELSLGIRVVIGDMWAGVGFGNPKIRQQQRHRLGCHGVAAIGVDGELPRFDPLTTLPASLHD